MFSINNKLYSALLLQLLLLNAIAPPLIAQGSEDFSRIFAPIKSDSPATVQSAAALAVIKRTLPAAADIIHRLFTVEIDLELLAPNTFYLFKDDNDDGPVQIRASSGVTACKAFYHYLKYYCNAHISWEGTQVRSVPLLVGRLPPVNISQTSASRFMYYQNVCTWSYSFVWCQWADWQRHIDWMATAGITLSLAPVQELVWTEVYTELGLRPNEIDEHFSGPAFMAWQRMGNLRGWAGPLSDAFKRSSSQLQRRVIQALRDLGMAVALPAFAGHVPRGMARLFPNTSFTSASKWNRLPDEFCCSLYIDPVDPLFSTIGEMFLKKTIAKYGGTNHIYFSDPFNEMQPSQSDSIYLANSAKGIYDTMRAADPDAVWLLQGWMFASSSEFWQADRMEAFLTAVPTGRMLVLDLQSEHSPQYVRSESFYGQPFIWCMLHNFGGTIGMHGSVEIVNREIKAAQRMKDSTMVGVGITPEGINQNYVMYEFALERGWQSEPFNASEWFDHYAFARYGESDEFIQDAWQHLRTSVYAYRGKENLHGKYIVCRRPSFNLTPTIWYNATTITSVWNDMLLASSEVQASPLFHHDLVDVTRQFFQNRIEDLYQQLIDAIKLQQQRRFLDVSQEFIEAIVDMDRILSTGEQFLVGRWLTAAKALASNAVESEQFEWNARNQITLWGPDGQIVDYAMKQWSGVVADYCLPRWQLFIDACLNAMATNKKCNMKKFRERVYAEVERPWTMDRKEYGTEPSEKAGTVSRELYAKWIGRI